MEFVLTGFKQDANTRCYAFERVDSARLRTEFTVGVDLASLRRHGIPLQELPLLCRRLLEEHTGVAHALTFSEHDMLGYVNNRTTQQEANDKKRRGRFKPALAARAGAGWRTPKLT